MSAGPTKESEKSISEQPLSAAETALLEDCFRQLKAAEGELQVILRAVMRVHKLDGNWTFDVKAPDKLTRVG